MIGTTLGDIRSHIETLASEDGTYFLICARYRNQPIPATGLRFETRATARAAARATEQYWAALRRYDPRLPCYDVVVCQDGREGTDTDPSSETDGAGATGRSDCAEHASDLDHSPGFGPVHGMATCGRSNHIEFCHRVAAAVFEALDEGGHDGVESAVMDVYFERAESVSDLDNLCLCLLDSMATEIEEGLTPNQQARVIDTAVSRLPASDSTDQPVAATLASLEQHGLIGEYRWSSSADRHGTDTGEIIVQLSEYALSPRNGRLPVLPIIVELIRHLPAGSLSSLDVVDVDDGWQIRVDRGRDGTPDELVNARILTEF